RTARHALEILLENRYPRAPATPDPEPVAENEHRVHIQAGRPLEILLQQKARTQPGPFAEVDQCPPHQIDVTPTPDIIRGRVVPPEDVVALVPRQQIHHRDARIPRW